VAGLFAAGIIPLLEGLFKSLLLGAVLIGSAIVDAAIAIPPGVVTAWLFLGSWTRKRRIIAGVGVAFGAFVFL